MKLNLRGNSLGFIYLLGGNSRGLAMDDSKAVFDKAIAEASVVFNRTKTVYERDDELRGGLVDLAKHAQNLRDLEISDIDIHHMVETNPLKLLNSQL